MATYYINPQAAVHGSGTFLSPFKTNPTLASGDTYLWRGNSVWTGRTGSYAPNIPSVKIGVYDEVTGNQVTDGSKIATWDWRNTLVASSHAVQLQAGCSSGWEICGLRIMAGWFVNVLGVTYQCIANHTSSVSSEPGVGASWLTYWHKHKNYLSDSPIWASGVSYQCNNGGCLQFPEASTDTKFSHVETVGCALGVNLLSAGKVNLSVDGIKSSMCWGGSCAIVIGGKSAAPMANPSIKNIEAEDSKSFGILLKYITGQSTIIDSVFATKCGAGGVSFAYVYGVSSTSIRNIISNHNTGSNVLVDSGCSDITIDHVNGDYASDNGFSGNDDFYPGHAPNNCTIKNYSFRFCGNKDMYTANPASDGDGFSCHAGTNWTFVMGISVGNLNSGASHVGGSTGKIIKSLLKGNGYQLDGTPSPEKYNRGGLALINSGQFELIDSIVTDNRPFNVELSSPSLLKATRSVLDSDGLYTTTLSDRLGFEDFVSEVAANGGELVDVSDADPQFVSNTDYCLQPTSPCLGAGTKITGITTDIEGNPIFPPYNIGPYGLADGALGVVSVANDGPPRNNITRLTGDSLTIDPTDTYQFADTNGWRVVTGWTAGTANFAFDVNGTPISFTGQQAIDAGIGPRFYCGLKGIAGYTVDQDAAANAKIIRTLKVPTYIDTLYWSDSAEMDWSASNE